MASAVPDSSPAVAPATAVPGSSAAVAPAIKPLTCPNCGGAIEIKAAGYTVTLACPYCGSLLDVADPDVKVIQRYNEMNRALAIPLGTRGTLKGIEWETIGHLRKSEGGEYPWEEYLLFNPYAGYRWLVTDGRGWTFGTMLTETPGQRGGMPVIDGQSFSPFFAEGRAQVDDVLGEFYWRVKRGEQAATADYVRPGFMLSLEANETERSWTLGELLDRDEIAGAFGVDKPPPWKPGGKPPLPHQPSPYGKAAASVVRIALAAAAALFVMSFIFGGTGPSQSFAMTLRPGAEAATQTFGPVELTRATQGVTISAQAPTLSNAWVDLDYALVDRRTQTAYQAGAVAERYTGRDSDGDWSEGSRRATTKFATVPAGSYDLVVDASASIWGSGGASTANTSIFGPAPGALEAQPVPVTISIAQGATFFSNIVLALIALAIPAIFVVWRHLAFEAARQGESDQGSAMAEMLEGDDD